MVEAAAGRSFDAGPERLSVMNGLSSTVVLAAGVYLVLLGAVSIVRPARARRFLASFASSARAHFIELSARLVVGAALIMSASRMRLSGMFVIFGWVLVGTTLVLLAVPWQRHRQFAAWSVPLATRHMFLWAVGPLVGGSVVLWALLG